MNDRTGRWILGALAPSSAYSKPDTLKALSISSTSISVPPLCKTNWESSPGKINVILPEITVQYKMVDSPNFLLK